MTGNNLALGAALTILSALLVSGCNTATSAVEGKDVANSQVVEKVEEAEKTGDAAKAAAENAGQASLAAESADKDKNQLEVAKVINQPGTVTKRGGHVPIIVNKIPITNFDVSRRQSFLKLRRVGGNLRKQAENEMIEQVLKLQEARRRRVLATDEMVNTAFANFAKSNRATPARMASQLNQFGIGEKHFKEFIRTQISWQRAVQGRFQSETRRKSERDVVLQMRREGTDKPEVTEYNLKQIVFVVPESKRSNSLLKARRAEATAFRQRFSGCDNTVELAKTLQDVSVLERNRIMEPELPEIWKDSVPGTKLNEATRPVETPRGIELMAVCDRRSVNDDRAAQVSSQASDFESFNEKGSELSKQYLEEVKSRATIVYR